MRHLVPIIALVVFALPLTAGEDKIPGIGPVGKVTKLHT